MNIDFNKIMKQINPFMIIAFVSYIFCYALFLNLPITGVEENTYKNTSISYQSYSGFYTKKTKNSPVRNAIGNNLNNTFKLKAIYETSDNKGFILIEDINEKQSFPLSINESIKGYKLVKIFTNHVYFEQYNKRYDLVLSKDTTSNKSLVYEINSIKNISKKDLNYYTKDMSRIWNNIQIIQTKNKEFKITKLNKNSIFEKLGLKQGDIIKSINNKNLITYNDAFKAYENINKISYLKLQIKRNNNIMELEYEID